jgi:hypothetical protein
MIKFHQEIIHQEQSQNIYVPRLFMPSAAPTPRSPSLQSEREDDLVMISKLTKLKKVKKNLSFYFKPRLLFLINIQSLSQLHKQVNKCLRRVTTITQGTSANLASLEGSKVRLAQVLAKKLKLDSQFLEAELRKQLGPETVAAAHDHSACRDCSQTHMTTAECLVQLDSYDRQVSLLFSHPFFKLSSIYANMYNV